VQVLTPFEQACLEHEWSGPTAFLQAFQATADILGENAATVTERQFLRWRRPNPPLPRPAAWRVLHAMFGVSPHLLGFPRQPQGATVGTGQFPGQRGEPPVKRRGFLADTAGVAAAAALPAHIRPLTPPGTSGAVGAVHLLELREGLRSLFQLDDAYGGDEVRSLAVKHLRRVKRILNTRSYPAGIGRQLQLLAGEVAEHCGWLHFDAEDQDSAHRYWGEALTTATVLKDANLQILVMSSMCLQACHEGRPREGLELARAAQERAKRLGSPTLRSITASREARALSLLGDGSGAKKSLADAMRALDQPGRGRPAPEWTAFHGHAELQNVHGILYADLGHHGAAVTFLAAALDQQDRTYGRNRALYRLRLASSLVRSGRVDEGAAQAVGSLEHLDEVESGRVTKRLSEVTDLLRHKDAASARAAVDELTEYVHARGAA
jgi:tetratricopeptide (TPR) repeat protein